MIKSGLSALYKMLAVALGAQFTLRPQGMPFRTRGAPPSSPRYWHDPTDAKHLDRMQEAEERRERRADKLKASTHRSQLFNAAHFGLLKVADDGYILPLNLNPFYVAK